MEIDYENYNTGSDMSEDKDNRTPLKNVQLCDMSISFEYLDRIMLTNHDDLEGSEGKYVYYLPQKDKHYVMILQPNGLDKFVWVNYYQLIKTNPCPEFSED